MLYIVIRRLVHIKSSKVYVTALLIFIQIPIYVKPKMREALHVKDPIWLK